MIGGVGGAVYCYKKSPYLIPLCLCLIGISALFAFGKMHRAEWLLYDWLAFALFGVVLFVAAVSYVRARHATVGLEEVKGKIYEILNSSLVTVVLVAVVLLLLKSGRETKDTPRTPEEVIATELWSNVAGTRNLNLTVSHSAEIVADKKTAAEGTWGPYGEPNSPFIRITVGGQARDYEYLSNGDVDMLVPLYGDRSFLLANTWLALHLDDANDDEASDGEAPGLY